MVGWPLNAFPMQVRLLRMMWCSQQSGADESGRLWTY